MKLAYWPTVKERENTFGSDLDWDWIKSLEKKRIGELRVDEEINGHDNVRIIFFKANQPLQEETMNRIWLLTVFQKKRQDFSAQELRTFRAMRDVIVHRIYQGSSSA